MRHDLLQVQPKQVHLHRQTDKLIAKAETELCYCSASINERMEREDFFVLHPKVAVNCQEFVSPSSFLTVFYIRARCMEIPSGLKVDFLSSLY